MKNLLVISVFLFIFFDIFSQDTTYFDKDWNKIKKRKNPSYYRVKSYIDKSKVYFIEDFYISGVKQMTGTYKSINPHIKYGYFMWWYPNGQISEKGTYIDNKREGAFFKWDSLGNIISEANYSNGKINGLYKGWYKNGQLKDSVNYSNGKLDGVVVSFYDNGNLLSNDIYKNDSLVKGACFKKNGNDTTYFPFVEKAYFKGGLLGFRDFVMSKLHNPVNAALDGLQGIVNVSFDVNTSGKVVNVRVTDSSDEIFNNSALQAVASSPQWKPGKRNGKLVKMSFTIPVIYKFR
jgi:TonB family protein